MAASSPHWHIRVLGCSRRAPPAKQYSGGARPAVQTEYMCWPILTQRCRLRYYTREWTLQRQRPQLYLTRSQVRGSTSSFQRTGLLGCQTYLTGASGEKSGGGAAKVWLPLVPLVAVCASFARLRASRPLGSPVRRLAGGTHNWSDLPADLLRLVFLDLGAQAEQGHALRDAARLWLAVAGVCRAWRTAALSEVGRAGAECKVQPGCEDLQPCCAQCAGRVSCSCLVPTVCAAPNPAQWRAQCSSNPIAPVPLPALPTPAAGTFCREAGGR